jgi:hypothetical protein
LERGKGLIGVGGHMGNWEVMGASCAGLGIPGLLHRQAHPRPRPGRGGERRPAGPRRGDPLHARRLPGRAEALPPQPAHRLPQRPGRPLPRRVRPLLRAAGLHARGAPPATPCAWACRCMFVNCLRRPGGVFEVEFVEVPVEAGWTHDEEHVQALTARFTALLEERVRRDPRAVVLDAPPVEDPALRNATATFRHPLALELRTSYSSLRHDSKVAANGCAHELEARVRGSRRWLENEARGVPTWAGDSSLSSVMLFTPCARW